MDDHIQGPHSGTARMPTVDFESTTSISFFFTNTGRSACCDSMSGDDHVLARPFSREDAAVESRNIFELSGSKRVGHTREGDCYI